MTSKPVVQFSKVSKKYKLGLTRTSLLRTFSTALGKIYNSSESFSKKKDVLWALSDVSFELERGESLALIGRNGAGKSTTLKLLANITRPTSGQININGRLSALIELGSGFHPDLTGRENIFMNGTILGLKRSEIQHRYDEIVAFSELERFIETPVKRYSSGMLVRLGFAVASCIEPDILLVDEVLAVGDAPFRQKCVRRIQSLLQNGTSIIFVSHNLYMVQAVCRDALYLESGLVMFRGDTLAAIDRYERDLHEERAKNFIIKQSEQEQKVTEVQVVRIDIFDADGVKKSEFDSDEQLEIQVHYHKYGLGDLANAVVRIVRTDGVTCCMMRTTLDDFQLTLQRESGAFSVIIEELQLAGGSYYVDVRITNEMDNVVLASGWSDSFYVSGLSLSLEEQSGIFEPKRNWKNYGRTVKSTNDDGNRS